MPSSVCPTLVLQSARGLSYRVFRALTGVKSLVTEYDAAVIQAAKYCAVAMGGAYVDGGTGDPLYADVLDAAIAEVQAAAALVQTTSATTSSGTSTTIEFEEVVRYDNLYSFVTGCTLPASILGRGNFNGMDAIVKLQLARASKRFAANQQNVQVMEYLRHSDLWSVIRFPLSCYHLLERTGMHAVIVAEYASLFSTAQAQDDFSVYTKIADLIGELTITDGYVPDGLTLTSNTRNLLKAVAAIYKYDAIRSYRYEITSPHPEQPEPPVAPSGMIRCG